MFTGIIETTGIITQITASGSNKSFEVESGISTALKPDQSVAHDGVCLTIESVSETRHRVTAIEETLKKTTLGQWTIGTRVNLERCLQFNGRIDGHFVQGHADGTAQCIHKSDREGSIELRFRIPENKQNLIIEKGSVTLNGISLTCFDVSGSEFSVAIIPYTAAHTTIGNVAAGMAVNIEYDLIGKYIERIALNALPGKSNSRD